LTEEQRLRPFRQVPGWAHFGHAIEIARQIAAAIESAHEQGVIHRDLKPANIKLRPDGTVKVLDFGLAKAFEPAATEPNAVGGPSVAPTITTPAMTGVGVILGTAAYMSPEQAKGRPADKRSDVWAFGCVFYEMLSGRRPFDGEDVNDVLASVLKSEPDWIALPLALRPSVRALIHRCLIKDRRHRVADLAAATFVLADPATLSSEPDAASSAARTRWWPIAAAVAGAALAGAALAAWVVRQPSATTPNAFRTAVVAPPDTRITDLTNNSPARRLALSADGQRLAFTAGGPDGHVRLWTRDLDAAASRLIDGPENVTFPHWSPDGRYLAFFEDARGSTKLRKFDTRGGQIFTLTEIPGGFGAGLAWSRADIILFSSGQGGIQRISAAGGAPAAVTTLDRARGETGHWAPALLPDGRHFLYLAVGRQPRIYDANGLFVGSLDGGAAKQLMPVGSNAHYANGYLLFLRDATLVAQPFDAQRLELSGEAMPVADRIAIGGATGRTGAFTVSGNVLAYQTASPVTPGQSRLAWLDHEGRPRGTLGDVGDYGDVELSPDGKRVVVSVAATSPPTRDLWLIDVARALRTRVTSDPGDDVSPVWSPDSRRIIYASRRNGRFAMFEKDIDDGGREQLILANATADYTPTSWSPDARHLLYSTTTSGVSQLWTLPLDGDRQPRRFAQSQFAAFDGRFSPDGRWVAYGSTESGRSGVYVAPFPEGAAKWQIAAGGSPRWHRDGRSILFTGMFLTLFSADVDGRGTEFAVGDVRRLFDLRARIEQRSTFDVSSDGERLLVNSVEVGGSPEPVTLLVNWPATIKR
jgi:eukaryotic-like serine/threonine-protein kinase